MRGLFPRGRHAHGNSQRAFTRSLPRPPLSLLPSPSLASPPPLLLFLPLRRHPALRRRRRPHTHTHTHTRALAAPVSSLAASAPSHSRARLLSRARSRTFFAVFCCCCCCCCNSIAPCAIPGIEFREWRRRASGPLSLGRPRPRGCQLARVGGRDGLRGGFFALKRIEPLGDLPEPCTLIGCWFELVVLILFLGGGGLYASTADQHHARCGHSDSGVASLVLRLVSDSTAFLTTLLII